MLTVEELQKLRQERLDDVDINTLTDLKNISVDTSISKEKRVEKLLSSGINPYLFRVGDMKIKVVYSNTGKTLSDIIENLVEKAEF
ncbi:TPA: hypothetical protein KNN56_001753 [Clostridioides difficile]|uniref:DUF6870 family protein n=1 Tax=Clostridioides difficile TaxID=1496 RepID=UPI00038CA1E5|nr:hypothetical protein [Clostridioides difficile]EGT4625337.1 hypothetical protein [Clostridioides difficile]ELX4576128.1 hypothetical protein [Clostridioides difficile]EQK76088.1 hypothetical protein QEE_1778 [Clostridioides difficile CD113]MBY2144991.1 hypothetical protein [Clostridioides difficile]MBY2820782.1 hypothetical protein [Clostridioides difficile]